MHKFRKGSERERLFLSNIIRPVGDNWAIDCPGCGEERILVNIGNAVRAYKTKALCHSCSKTGEKHYTFGKVIKSPKYVAGDNPWRKKIIERDKCCQVCGETENLEAHHIFGKASMPFLRQSLNNGITLCKYHHAEFHTLNGKKQIFKINILKNDF